MFRVWVGLTGLNGFDLGLVLLKMDWTGYGVVGLWVSLGLWVLFCVSL